MSKLKEKYRKLDRGEIVDDYKNHFYSHFGFYDEYYSDYSYSKYHNTTYDITTGPTISNNA